MLNMTSLPSVNFGERAVDVPLQYIVLHYTGMPTGQSALDLLCDANAENRVSAHYMIEEDGHIFQLVDESKRAWHAGKSFWRDTTDLNSASIGIELVNPGHEFGYRDFPSQQIAALKELMHDIIKRHNLSAETAPIGHSDIAPDRKADPGERFPWKELAKNGLGIWPSPQPSDYNPMSDAETQTLLRAIGYHCPETGIYDRVTRAAILAFQRHYHQENLTGTPEPETLARLLALHRQLGYKCVAPSLG